jgi:hypothetical protein
MWAALFIKLSKRNIPQLWKRSTYVESGVYISSVGRRLLHGWGLIFIVHSRMQKGQDKFCGQRKHKNNRNWAHEEYSCKRKDEIRVRI